MATKIDIAFFPDTDYGGNYNLFTTDLQGIIRGAFFNTSDERFSRYYTNSRNYFNLWAAPFGANATGCSRRDFPNPTDLFIGAMDGRVILHTEDFGDCAAIALGASGTVSTNSIRVANGERPEVIFVHESGHFLHGLGDEHDQGGGYRIGGDCANIFESQAACNAAPERSLPRKGGGSPPICRRVSEVSGTLGFPWWRGEIPTISGAVADTMKESSAEARWETDCAYCIGRRFGFCKAGSCY